MTSAQAAFQDVRHRAGIQNRNTLVRFRRVCLRIHPGAVDWDTWRVPCRGVVSGGIRTQPTKVVVREPCVVISQTSAGFSLIEISRVNTVIMCYVPLLMFKLYRCNISLEPQL